MKKGILKSKSVSDVIASRYSYKIVLDDGEIIEKNEEDAVYTYEDAFEKIMVKYKDELEESKINSLEINLF